MSSATGQIPPGGPVTMPQGNVSAGLTELENHLDRLLSDIDMLTDRLDPILLPLSGDEGIGKQADHVRSKLAEQIESSAIDKVILAKKLIRQITERIDL